MCLLEKGFALLRMDTSAEEGCTRLQKLTDGGG